MSRIYSTLLFAIVVLITSSATAQDRSLTKTFTLEVPARSAFGERPTRDLGDKGIMLLPPGFEVNRQNGMHGLVELDKHRDGLDQDEYKIEPVDRGVKIIWKLKNPDIRPHTARLVVRLHGTAISPVSFSAKYWAFRIRFLDTFYHQGRIACWVSPVQGHTINFGDQTIEMGHALMVFSTEIAICRKLSQPTDEPKRLINEILNAFDELDRKAEGRYGSQELPLNGYFVRDDIQGKDDPRLKRKYANVNSDWQNPADASPSGDQIFGMMSGLLCVVRFSEDPSLVARAKATSARLFDYVKRNKFILRLPDGNPNKRGEDLRWLSSLLHGLNHHITGNNLFGDCRIDVPLVGEMKLNGIASFWDTKTVHKLMPRVFNRDLTELLIGPLHSVVPRENGRPLNLNSFAIHILLMALAPSSIMSLEDFDAAALKADHHASVLWSALLHGRIPQGVVSADIAKILDACPDSGPHGGLSAESGWNKDNRWVRCTDIHNQPSSNHVHNGLDWLLLHNLNQLCFNR